MCMIVLYAYYSTCMFINITVCMIHKTIIMIKKLLLALAITALPVRSNAQKHFTIALSQRNIDILQKEVMDKATT